MVLLFKAVGYGLWIHTFPCQYIYIYIYIYISYTFHLNTLRFQKTIIYFIHLKWIFYNNLTQIYTMFNNFQTFRLLYHLPSINKSLHIPTFEAFSMQQASHLNTQFIHPSIHNFISSSNQSKLRCIQSLIPHQIHTPENHFAYRKLKTS
jgi:hypothetical protein